MQSGSLEWGAGRGPAARKSQRGVSPVYYVIVGLLMLTNAVTGVALTMTPEISRLFSGQADIVVAAYEDRITQLRIELDRLQSRSFAQAGDINLQLQELSAQQEILAEHHTLVGVLVDRARELGLETASAPSEPDTLEVSIASPLAIDSDHIGGTSADLAAMLAESRAAMAAIAAAAGDRADTIASALDGVGIAVDFPVDDLGTGGPLLDPVDTSHTAIDDANSALLELARYEFARSALAIAPVHMPIAGSFRQSSVFGNRRDPFSGNRAFHSGLDFAAASGTSVMSAGHGVVAFAGVRAGYGNLVEVAHEDGLVTRYAHLSTILVTTGTEVAAGEIIARVGSTGRSTGPHLHFEVRRGDTALDPAPFLATGRDLLAAT